MLIILLVAVYTQNGASILCKKPPFPSDNLDV